MFKVGDKYYLAIESINAFKRKKICMTDTDGVEWYRYDRPVRDYDIHEYTIIGKVIPVISGALVECDWSLTETMLHATCPGREPEVITQDDLTTWLNTGVYYFLSREAAEKRVAQAIEQDVHLDRL